MPRQLPPIFLLTDFGLADVYAGQLKAAVLKHFLQAQVVDLTHCIEPFNIRQAGFFLDTSLPCVPRGSVFVCVVDPGVGTPRDIILVRIQNRWVLAPDNGLISLALCHHPAEECFALPVEEGSSRTFHGRDVFAPVAAALAGGEDPLSLGSPKSTEEIETDPRISPRTLEGYLECLILHVDRFGNIILNLEVSGPEKDMLDHCQGYLAGHPLRPVYAYAGLYPGELGILTGSQGYLELAMDRASAASKLQVGPGEEIKIKLGENNASSTLHGDA